MARPRRNLSIEEQLKNAQEEYIKTRKHCEELAKEIDRLSQLKREEMSKQILDALSKSTKTFEEIMAFISGENSTMEED